MIWRMRGRAPFMELRRHGTKVRTQALSIAFLSTGNDGPAHMGYAISRRVGNAVTRNTLRRRLRAAVSRLAAQAEPSLRSGFYLVTPAPSARELSVAELGESLVGALRRLEERSDLSGAHR